MTGRSSATTRAGLTLVLAASTFTAAPADANRSCPLLRDRPGDGGSLNNWGGDWLPQDRSLDLLSVDLSSDASRLLTVIRVNKLSRTLDQEFVVRFRVAHTWFWVRAALARQPGVGTDRFLFGTAEEAEDGSDGAERQALGSATGWVGAERSTISMLLSTSQLRRATAIAPGTPLTGVYGRSYRQVAGALVGADWTDTSARYVFASGGCTPLPRR